MPTNVQIDHLDILDQLDGETRQAHNVEKKVEKV